MKRRHVQSAGFTLIELLVVIAIIGILAMMVTGGVQVARRKAMVATATANISALKIAITAYHSQMGIYPGAAKKGQPAKDDPEAIFRGLYTGNPKHGGTKDNQLEDWRPDKIGLWTGTYQTSADAIYERPTPEQLVFENTYTRCALLDAWGRPFHYVEWDSQPKTQTQLAGSRMKRQGAMPFMIWSDGPNKLNDWGEEDDVTSWGGTK